MAVRACYCIALCKTVVYKIVLGESCCYQLLKGTRTIDNMPPKKKTSKTRVEGAAAEDLKRAKEAKEEGEEVEDQTEEGPKKKKKKADEPDEQGDMTEKKAVLDKFGFCEVDGNRYLDGTSPADFEEDDSFHFMEGLKSELGNKFFSVRWAHLRGRSKRDGSLYSSPSVFLQKDWQGKIISFTLPDKHVPNLRKFLQEVEQEKLSFNQ